MTEQNIYNFIKELFPICRSITGDGTRETLQQIKSEIPIEIKEVVSGTKVFDWDIPLEWNIKDAYIKNEQGEKIVDFNNCNLHVVNYSTPINRKIKLSELKKHLHSLPNHPEWIPYRTTYYKNDWGFCLTHNQLKELKDEEYEVVIDSEKKIGALSYGELFIEGEHKEENLFSTHICHPSMCNDNLTGIAVNVALANYLQQQKRKYSYRFIFVPATIGAITWLAKNEDIIPNIKCGYVTALLGDSGKFNYKRSKNGNSISDKIAEFVLEKSGQKYKILDFSPYGYDERQFCSPGINLPIGRLTRTPNQEYAEYHTSADNLDFISKKKLLESFETLCEIVYVIENNSKYINLSPKCEPQLGKRGIYNSVAGNVKESELAILWILNYSDGKHDLIDISKLSGLSFNIIKNASNILKEHNLIEEIKN